MTRGLIVAAPRSGGGKTTVTLALLAALARRGVAVRAAKSGPDYIDPAFHAAACGRASLTLDSWAMPPALLDATLARAGADAELLLVESAMGLFDGIDAPPGRRGSAADLAARSRLPVLLVLDVSGQSQSVAAVARGFATHDPAVRVAGVVLNRVASPRHHAGAAAALREAGIALLGSVPRDPALALPERHLGLVQAREHGDLGRLLGRARRHGGTRPRPRRHPRSRRAYRAAGAGAGPSLPPPGQRIAVADDAAFSFLYPHLPPAGATPGPSWCSSRRWPTSRRRPTATAAGCPAAIPSCMPARSPPPTDSVPGWRRSRRPGRCMASAAATWCWGRRSPTPPAPRTR